jgi:ATP-dependent DNA ligase
MLELDVRDLRHQPIEKRKKLLAELLSRSRDSLVFNECFHENSAGCEGIVSKRVGSEPEEDWR